MKNPPTLPSSLSVLSVATLFSLALLVAACSKRTDEGIAPGSSAPDVVFRTLDGRSDSLREADGPRLVNFWSTTCVVCLEEAPALIGLAERYRDQGFELVSVAMPTDRPDAVLELARARGWTHPVAIDVNGAVLAAFEPVPGTPTSFLVDAGGSIVARWTGRTAIDEIERAVIDSLSSGADVSNLERALPDRFANDHLERNV